MLHRSVRFRVGMAIEERFILTGTRSMAACGYCIEMLSSENMRWKGSIIN